MKLKDYKTHDKWSDARTLLEQAPMPPPGSSGDWTVEHFTCTEDDVKLFNVRCFMSGMANREMIPGTYARLLHGRHVVMSNTKAEINDHVDFVRAAHGHVLIAGLGLAMVANACAAKESVDHVTVVEISPDVIALTSPVLHQKIEVVEHDIMTFPLKRGDRWDAAWFDIWADICADNLEQMKTLSRRYSHRTTVYGHWAEGECMSSRSRW